MSLAVSCGNSTKKVRYGFPAIHFKGGEKKTVRESPSSKIQTDMLDSIKGSAINRFIESKENKNDSFVIN